ncbi:MAG: hypothetical protein IIY21_26170 [Clostridiales bacterium]|nr:hypothetical protein [Clostridiales bacterium]MBQ1573097.1 hypothetical protein [Clostridiales bacterium]
MTAIQEIIEANYPNIGLNTENGRIVNDGKKVLDFVYTDLMEKYKEKCGVAITKTQVKEEVQRYAAEHPWTSEEKKQKQKKFESWSSGIEFDENDMPKRTLDNTVIFFTKHPKYKDKFSFNEVTQFENYNGQPIEDWMTVDFRLDCENVMGYNTKDLIQDAVVKACHENTFNPFRDAIEKLVWDGTERMETFFIKYLGAEDTQLNRSMTKKFFYAMMKRMDKPGCDFDNMLIVADPTQGTGKTKILMRFPKALGIPYGCDTTLNCDPKDKDNIDKMNRCWIAIIDELTNFLKKEPEVTKQFLAQSEDSARLSYDRRSRSFKRHCVFYATTNQDYFLKDYTGGIERRYWIMDCHGTPHDAEWWDTNLSDDEVRQVIAEIYKFYKGNPKFKYTELTLAENEELLKVQKRHKTARNDDVLQDQILRVINTPMYNIEFDNVNEFINNLNYWQSYTPVENNTRVDSESYEMFRKFGGGNKFKDRQQIELIPSKWLREWIMTYLKPRYTVQAGYLAEMLSDDFEYVKNGHYRKKDGSWWSTSVFRRKEKKGNNDDIQDS